MHGVASFSMLGVLQMQVALVGPHPDAVTALNRHGTYKMTC